MLVGIPLVGMTWGSLVVENSGFGCLVGNVCLWRSGSRFLGVMSCSVRFCWFWRGIPFVWIPVRRCQRLLFGFLDSLFWAAAFLALWFMCGQRPLGFSW